jgi:hypothetical protein
MVPRAVARDLGITDAGRRSLAEANTRQAEEDWGL